MLLALWVFCGIIVIMYLDERQANNDSIHVVPVVSNEINENTLCSLDVIVTKYRLDYYNSWI